MVSWKLVAMSLLERIDDRDFGGNLNMQDCAEDLLGWDDSIPVMDAYEKYKKRLNAAKVRESKFDARAWYESLPEAGQESV